MNYPDTQNETVATQKAVRGYAYKDDDVEGYVYSDSDNETTTPKNVIIKKIVKSPPATTVKTVKMTQKQIEKAEELKSKYLQEQNACLEELRNMVANKEITVVDLVKSVKSYRKILDSRNKHAKANYDKNKEVREEAKGYYNSIKERVEAYKNQLIQEEMIKINKEVIDLSNNLIVSERPVKRASLRKPKA